MCPPPTLPAHAARPAEAVHAAQTRAQIAREGAPAVYRRGGAGDGALVAVVLTPLADQGRTPPAGRTRPGPGTHARRYAVLLPALTPDETAGEETGVATQDSPTPGVLRLAPGDTLTVRGAAAGRADLDEVTLRVIEGVRCGDNTAWSGEAVP